MAKITRKTGALSAEEESYIRENSVSQSIYDIASSLNRTPDLITRYIKKHALQGMEQDELEAEFNAIRYELYQKNFWPEIQKQFSIENGEQEYFVTTWVNLVHSFGGDIKPPEELQLKQQITVEILLNKTVELRNDFLKEIDRLEKMRREEANKNEPDFVKISMLDGQVLTQKGALTQYNNDIVKLQERQSKIFHDLRALRDQRVTRVIDSKSSWASLIKRLGDIKEEGKGR